MSLAARQRLLKLRRLKETVTQLRDHVKKQPGKFAKYRNDCVGFCRDVLKVYLTGPQQDIARACQEPPYRVMVRSAHGTGKTFLAACIAVWWYFTRDPGVTITTAPTLRDVVDLLWTELRIMCQRSNLPDHFIGPRAPEMRTSDEHYAKGYTATRGESFQGRHRACMAFLFDEGEGIDQSYFITTKTMFQSTGDHLWLVILNPTTNDSPAALEEQTTGANGEPAWRLFTLSALDHPNIAAELAGQEPPIPNAVRLAQVCDMISENCDPMPDGSEDSAIDFEFPPGSGLWHRPNAIAEPRLLGRRPREGSNGCWSDALWETVLRPSKHACYRIPQIGCDVARYGRDYTSIHVRSGTESMHHESVNGWGTDRTAGRLKEIATQWCEWWNAKLERGMAQMSPKAIPIVVDDDGIGGAVSDQLRGWNVHAVKANTNAHRPDLYPSRRHELWFGAAAKARGGLLSIANLGRQMQAKLRLQLMAVTWRQTNDGRRQVESKDETVKTIGRSPDDADAFNLAYADVFAREAPAAIESKPPPPADPSITAANSRAGIAGKPKTPTVGRGGKRHWPGHLR